MLSNRGSQWIKKELQREPSPLGCLAADVLGSAWAGIYHLDIKSLKRVAWEDANYVAITITESLATFDANRLLHLVVAAHDAGLRLSIRAKTAGYLELGFNYPCAAFGFPTLDAAIAKIRKDLQL